MYTSPRHARTAPTARRRRRATRWFARTRLQVDLLEPRCLLDGGFRSITGFGNNIANPTWGESGTDLLRISPVAYADGLSAPSQPNTLSPREISNSLNNQSDPMFSGENNLGSAQSRSLSDFSYVWGQFIDHDMDLTPGGSGQSLDIPADPTMLTDPMGIEPFSRSTFDPNTGTSNPRQQINADTSFLDLSQVYGSSDLVADALRTHSGGQLKTSPGNLLPYDSAPYFTPDQIGALNLANDAQQVPSTSLFAAGDVRANENIELTAIQTLFLRNHNNIAQLLQGLHPSWTDDQLYQEARKLNIAEEEIITYSEFLPAILGPNPLPAFNGYNPNLNPGIATEFSTVGFRFGHSLLSDSVGRHNNNGTDSADVNPNGADVNLTEDFFRPDLINPNGVTVNLVDTSGNLDPHTSTGIGAILKGDADNAANETDLLLIDEVRNVLFGVPNGPGTDLAARDIQRARDHGIGTYNQVRVAYGLPAVTSFAQITSNVTVQQELQATYGSVDAIDPFEGMLAEDHLQGADVGPTIKAILARQFAALRAGDRFFYLNEGFNLEEQVILAHGNTLARVIEANTAITNLQANVFIFRESISGSVFLDTDGDGVRDPGEPPLTGFAVNLNDDSGAVVATTTTDQNGNYRFTDQTGIPGTGRFTVAVVLPPGWTQTPVEIGANPGTIALSRGGLSFTNQTFAVERTTVNFPGGFASVAGIQLNGSASVNGSALQLSDGGNSEAGSAFATSPVSVASFTTKFSIQLVNPNADGITFTLQGAGPTAVGGAGGGLGYQGIAPSVAVKFDLFNNNGEGADATGLYLNGAAPTNVGSVDLTGSGIDLHSGHVFKVELDYDGATLTETITDASTAASFTHSYTVNIAGVLGGGTGFAGFTAGTGALTATQNVLSWTYTPIGVSPNFTSGFASTAGLQLNGSAGVSGSRLRLTNGGRGEAASAFTTSAVAVSQFATSFNFQLTNPNADGFTFTLQAHDPSQLGAGGGGLGYQGIPNSVAIKFDLYNNSGEGINSTGLYLNGAAPTGAGSVDLTGSGINLHSGDVFNATLSYDGTTLTETITDTCTGASFTQNYTVILVAVLGRSTAFVGFTAATGGLASTQDILSWNYTAIA
jgi:hypothetical protein